MIKAQTNFTVFGEFSITKATVDRINHLLHLTVDPAASFQADIRLNAFKEKDGTVTFELFDVEVGELQDTDILQKRGGVTFLCSPTVIPLLQGITLDYNLEKDIFLFSKTL